MTQTTQPGSWATLSKTEKDGSQTEDDKEILLSLFDSMNKLTETVNRLNYVVQRKKLEQILFQEKTGGGEGGSASRSRSIDNAANAAKKGEEK
jgi:hypothetical protein